MAAPLLWALVLVAARRAGAAAVVGIAVAVAMPVGLALLPRGVMLGLAGLAAAMVCPALVLAAWVGTRGRAWGGGLAAAVHIACDRLPDGLDVPVRALPLTAETILALPPLWPWVSRVGWSAIDGALIAAAYATLVILWGRGHRQRPAKVLFAALLPASVAVALLLPAPQVASQPRRLTVGFVAPQGDPLESRMTALSMVARRRERAFMEERTVELVREGADLVVWPENGPGGGLRDTVESARALETRGASVWLGGDVYRDGASVAAMAVVEDGRLVTQVEKTRGVPGVEAAPRLADLPVLQVAGIQVAPLICYTSAWRWVFSGLVRQGAELVVVQSDATSFMHTSLPRIHWRLTSMFALEHGLPTVFVSRNGGVHAILPGAGRRLSGGAASHGLLQVELAGEGRS